MTPKDFLFGFVGLGSPDDLRKTIRLRWKRGDGLVSSGPMKRRGTSRLPDPEVLLRRLREHLPHPLLHMFFPVRALGRSHRGHTADDA